VSETREERDEPTEGELREEDVTLADALDDRVDEDADDLAEDD